MTTVGPNSAGNAASIADANEGWTLSAAVLSSSDDSYANVQTLATSGNTELLAATQFGFAIPASTINGITVEIEASDGGTSQDTAIDLVRLTKDGTTGVGSDLEVGSQALTLTDTYYTYGDAANLWGTTWTVSEINASTFGVLVRGLGVEAGNAGSIWIDHIRITVEYTAAGIPVKMASYRRRRAA